VTGIESEPEADDPVAFPRLTDAQLVRLRSYGTPQMVGAGDVLYGPGDATYDFIVIEDATVEIVQPATRDAPKESLVRFGPGSFLGELNLLSCPTSSLRPSAPGVNSSRTTAPPGDSSSSAARSIRPRSRSGRMRRGDDFRTSGSTPTPSPGTR
jgi:CRP-like cAMP-binding protein